MPVEDAAEVERRAAAFERELQPSGEVGRALTRHAALTSVRMERCAEREMAATAERVRRAVEEFEAPEGVDDEEADRLRAEAARLAWFDLSKAACLERRYEAAARNSFFRSLQELRRVEKAAKADSAASAAAEAARALGSFSRATQAFARPSAPTSKPAPLTPPKPVRTPEPPAPAPLADSFYVPIAIGRPR